MDQLDATQIESKGKELREAFENDDSGATARILDEVGSCNWNDVVKKGLGTSHRLNSSQHTKIESNGDVTFTLNMGRSKWANPFATVTDKPCKG